MIHHQSEFRIADILDRIRRIATAETLMSESTGGSSSAISEMAFDAILYNLVVIGEAVKSLDIEMKLRSPHIKWREITGLRDLLAHKYFQIDVTIIKASINQPLEDVRLACIREQQKMVGCEGLELHILHRPHMDSIDLDPQPILGIGSDIY